MLLQLLASQPLPRHTASEDEIFEAGIAQGKSLDVITREINEMKKAKRLANAE